jgi:hypothetical protein
LYWPVRAADRPVRWRHAAVRTSVEAAVQRRHLRRHGCVTGCFAYKTRASSTLRTPHRPAGRH